MNEIDLLNGIISNDEKEEEKEQEEKKEAYLVSKKGEEEEANGIYDRVYEWEAKEYQEAGDNRRDGSG